MKRGQVGGGHMLMIHRCSQLSLMSMPVLNRDRELLGRVINREGNKQ